MLCDHPNDKWNSLTRPIPNGLLAVTWSYDHPSRVAQLDTRFTIVRASGTLIVNSL
jgi:hypothetical protein